jgi:hypothetical protein
VCDGGELVMLHYQVIRYIDTQRIYTAAAAAYFFIFIRLVAMVC